MWTRGSAEQLPHKLANVLDTNAQFAVEPKAASANEIRRRRAMNQTQRNAHNMQPQPRSELPPQRNKQSAEQ